MVKGCKAAGIGCLECKQSAIDSIVAQRKPWRERAAALTAEPKKVHRLVESGTEHARGAADDEGRARGDGLDY